MGLMLVIVGIFFGLVAASIARHKGRGEVLWFLLGFFFHVFALVVLFLSPVCKPGIMKRCTECAEIIKAGASVCRYCGREITAADALELS